MSDRTVIVGPKPTGADTGVAVGFNSLIQAMETRGLDFALVNSVPGRVPDRPGKASMRRALASVFVILNAWVVLIGAKRLYMTLSTSKGGFIRGAAIILWAWLFRCGIVLHLKGGGFREFYDGQGRGMQAFIRFVMSKSDRIIALGDLLVEQFSMISAYQDRVVVIPNGFPANMEVPEEIERQRVEGHTFRILYLSNLIPSKGLIYLMDAVLNLRERDMNIYLEIAGSLKDVTDGQDGEFSRFLNDFESKLAELGVHAKFHSTVFGEAKEALFRQADVFCLPTFYPWEGQPISIIEALAYGLPVIATPHKGIPEEVIDGSNGRLIEPQSASAISDAVAELYKDIPRYQAFSRAARQHFEQNFKREVHQERLVNCILGKGYE